MKPRIVLHPPAALFVVGASGVGKTSAVRILEQRPIAGLRCYYFDSIGVPSPEVMQRDFGGGEGWQAAATSQWIDRLSANAEEAEIVVLDGQTRPSYITEALAHTPFVHYRILLLDCAPGIRVSRLGGREQTHLATVQMDMWAAYLRGQADALGLSVLDTSIRSAEGVADELEAVVAALRQARNVTT